MFFSLSDKRQNTARRDIVRYRPRNVYGAGKFRFAQTIEAQSDMPQFTQVLLGYAADRRDRIAMLAQFTPRARLQRAGQFAMTMDEAKFFDIRLRAFPKRNQHLFAERLLRVLADTGDGGLINHAHV